MTENLGIGRALAEARQAQGLELADISQQLKFMTRQIEALEAERFDSLPGPTIARGMVRTYARFLKLDPEPLLEKMAGRVEAKDATPQLAARFQEPVPFADGGRRSTAVYLGLSVVVLAAAGLVFYQWRHEHAAPAFVVADAQPPAKARAEAPAAPRREQVARAAPPAPPVTPVTPVTRAEPVEAAPVAKSAPVAAPKPAAPAPEAALPVVAAKDYVARTAGPHRLVLRFEEEAWAEVIDSQGRQLVSSLNPAGTERVVRVSPPFNLVIGNAQHVKVSYNDREIDLQPHVKVEVARFTVR